MHSENEDQHDDSLSQWVGEAHIKGSNEVLPLPAMLTAAVADGSTNRLPGWAAIHLYIRPVRRLIVGSVEQSYGVYSGNVSNLGTPYLLSLGLSKAQMSLVWLAGPLSGIYLLC
jgi:hypothetical protein